MVDAVRDVVFRARLVDQMSGGLQRIGGGFARFASTTGATLRGVSASIFNVRTAVLGLGSAFLGSKIVQAFRSVATEGGKLYETSRRLGISTNIISELGFAFDQLGGSSDDAGAALGRLAKVLGEVRRGENETARKAFRDLGISLQDINDLTPDKVFDRLAHATMRYGDASDRAAVLSKIFGRGLSENVITVLSESIESIQAAREEARKLGLSLGPEAAKKLDQFDDTMKKFGATVRAVFRDFVVANAEKFTEALEASGRWIREKGQGVLSFFQSIGSLIATAIDGWRQFFNLIGMVEESADRAHAKRVARHHLEMKVLNEEREALRQEGFSGPLSAFEDVAASRTRGRSLAGSAFSGAQLEEETDRQMKLLHQARASAGPAPTGASGAGGGAIVEELSAMEEGLRGFSRGIKSASEDWADFGKQGEEAGRRLSNVIETGLTDGITDFILGTKSGKEAFKEFGKAVLKEIVAMIVKLLIVRTIMSALGFGPAAPKAHDESAFFAAKGGVVHGRHTPWQHLPGYARGGVVNRPHIAMVGEGRGAEAIVPLPDNRSIPVSFTDGGMGSPTINFNLHSPDAKGVRRMLIEERQTIIGMVIGALDSRGKARTAVRAVI